MKENPLNAQFRLVNLHSQSPSVVMQIICHEPAGTSTQFAEGWKDPEHFTFYWRLLCLSLELVPIRGGERKLLRFVSYFKSKVLASYNHKLAISLPFSADFL